MNMTKKIEKLLSLSNSDNPHEARAAMIKAQELMVRYNQESFRSGYENDIISEPFDHAIKREYEELPLIVSSNFRTMMYFNRRGRVVFMGIRSDVMATVSCLRFLLYQMRIGQQTYIREKWYEAHRDIPIKEVRTTWCKGYISGIEQAFMQQVVLNGFELMITPPPEVIEKYNTLNLITRPISDDETNDCTDAFNSGEKVGRVVMNKRSLESSD